MVGMLTWFCVTLPRWLHEFAWWRRGDYVKIPRAGWPDNE